MEFKPVNPTAKGRAQNFADGFQGVESKDGSPSRSVGSLDAVEPMTNRCQALAPWYGALTAWVRSASGCGWPVIAARAVATAWRSALM